MQSPSPQLLRALRTSLTGASNTFTLPASASRFRAVPSNASLCVAVNTQSSIPSAYRHNSSAARSSHPARLIPRSHTHKPIGSDRGPESGETNLDELNVLGGINPPVAAVDATLDDGFDLSNGVHLRDGNALLLVGGEPFEWRPWKAIKGAANDSAAKAAMVNAKGQFEVPEEVWNILSIVWPRPDILVLGLGATPLALSPETKRHINSLGIRVELQDTRNAAGQFNLLATERGVEEVAAAILPMGWKGRK